MVEKKVTHLEEQNTVQGYNLTRTILFTIPTVKPSHTNDVKYYCGYGLLIGLKLPMMKGMTSDEKEIHFPLYIM